MMLQQDTLCRYKILIKVVIFFWYESRFGCWLFCDLVLGVSKFMECDIGFYGQQGDVESEVCNLAKEIFGTGVVYESLEWWKEFSHWIWHPIECIKMWKGAIELEDYEIYCWM